MVWPHQWDIVAGIPTPPERGCGQLSYGELCCSCVGHRGGFHPMCVDASSCTCTNVYDHPVDDLCLAISLGVESRGLSELGIQHRPET
jgi:hypothetical protein